MVGFGATAMARKAVYDAANTTNWATLCRLVAEGADPTAHADDDGVSRPDFRPIAPAYLHLSLSLSLSLSCSLLQSASQPPTANAAV